MSKKKTSRPNILYITADDLGTRLGAYGHDVDTPNIDALARDGVLFEECHCQSAICGGSRTSILTGLRPETSGVNKNDDPWRGNRTDTVTLPRLFRDNGYRTYGVGKIEDSRNGTLDNAWTVRGRINIRSQSQVNGLLLQIAEQKSGPFFAAIGYKQPHCPWTNNQARLDKYPDPRVYPELGPGRVVKAKYLQNCIPDRWDHLPGNMDVTLSDADALDIARSYLASVSELDSMVGHTLKQVENLGLMENTIIIFWSGDHRYALGDSDHWGKWIPRQSISRIPLIIKFPDGRGANNRVTGLVEAIDMYPALMELCDLSAPPQPLDGISFGPMIDDPGKNGKDFVFTRFGNASGVSDGRWNYERNHFWGTEELYDRVTDPQELVNVITDHPKIHARLSKALDDLPSVLTFSTYSDHLKNKAVKD